MNFTSKVQCPTQGPRGESRPWALDLGPWSSLIVLAVILLCAEPSHAWWNKEWSARKKFTVDTTAATGVEIQDPIGGTVILLRLHQGNFPFGSAREDGSDLRFVTEDDKTVLPHLIEKYDSLMNEAFVWVKVPDVKPGAQTSFWLYSGHEGEITEKDDSARDAYDGDTLLVYHFAEHNAPAVDASGLKNTAENAGTPSDGSLIGTGLRLLGKNLVRIPASTSLEMAEGGDLTWSAWIKSSSNRPNAVIFSRREGSNAFLIGVDNGVPYAEVSDASGVKRTPPGEPIPQEGWKHLAVVAGGGKITLYLNGTEYATLDARLPSLKGPAMIGGDAKDPAAREADEGTGFVGEIDELEISRVARPLGSVKLAAISQGVGEEAGKLVAAGEDEGGEAGGGHILEHLALFGDIANNMMFDGWVVIFCCGIMAVVGWTVAIKKFLYLNRIQKGSEEFMTQWTHVAADLTALDHTDTDSVKSLGGKADAKIQNLMHQSPLYHIYHIGSEEIRHRLQNSKGGFEGLSARSIQAIRASLDAGLTREIHRLNGGLIYLTISIAGGPYVGLLGTVMGVMITFAVIAKTGEVEVNSIAPGIASALLATVAGLLVAIPALFIYSYLSTRIKDAVSTMQMFIDEFVTKMAEFYPPPNEIPVPRISVESLK